MPIVCDSAARSTVIVGMSGGVDSAVAALLLKQFGYEVQGLFMSNWDDAGDEHCTVAEDLQDARKVCDALDIPLHTVSFAEQYRERVFAHFLKEHAAGRTPNPDVLCNREIKFGVCLDYMRRLGAAWIGTGHYARIARGTDSSRLFKAADAAKDQTYFLHGIEPTALHGTLFPIGDLTKSQVRAKAHAAGLAVFDKPDSTGICFIGERNFPNFLKNYFKEAPGTIRNARGEVIGEHRGLFLYTLGQRSGLGIGGRAGAAAAPWYVAAKDLERNALIVVQDPNHPLLLSRSFQVETAHWLSTPPLTDDAYQCSVKTRYRQADMPCSVRLAADGSVQVRLATAARAVTPGQYAVFYQGAECLGGGVIGCVMAYNDALSAEGS